MRLLNRSLIPLFLMVICHNSLSQESCIPANQWFTPNTGDLYSNEDYLNRIPKQGIILLGEHHENRQHHHWQLVALQAIYEKQPDLAIGLEMFPQYLQNVLDDWVNKKINKAEFLEQSKWNEIWAYDFNDYLPLLEFARDKQIPLIAINVQKQLLRMVREVGWDNIPKDHRQGITNPAKPSKDYIRQLAVSFRRHFDPTKKIDKQAFLRFVEQQQLWDRAMAQGLIKYKSEHTLIVGILGSWHIINGFGVPHQLQDLGLKENDIVSYIPWDAHLDCQSISNQFSTAIFGTPSH